MTQVNNRLVPVHQVIINTTHIALVHALISCVTEATVMTKRQKRCMYTNTSVAEFLKK